MSSETTVDCRCSSSLYPYVRACRRTMRLEISSTRFSISSAPSSAAFAYLSCQAWRSSATVSRAARRISSSPSSGSCGPGTGSAGRALACSASTWAVSSDGGAEAGELATTDDVVGLGVVELETDSVGLLKDDEAVLDMLQMKGPC